MFLHCIFMLTKSGYRFATKHEDSLLVLFTLPFQNFSFVDLVKKLKLKSTKYIKQGHHTAAIRRNIIDVFWHNLQTGVPLIHSIDSVDNSLDLSDVQFNVLPRLGNSARKYLNHKSMITLIQLGDLYLTTSQFIYPKRTIKFIQRIGTQGTLSHEWVLITKEVFQKYLHNEEITEEIVLRFLNSGKTPKWITCISILKENFSRIHKKINLNSAKNRYQKKSTKLPDPIF